MWTHATVVYMYRTEDKSMLTTVHPFILNPFSRNIIKRNPTNKGQPRT